MWCQKTPCILKNILNNRKCTGANTCIFWNGCKSTIVGPWDRNKAKSLICNGAESIGLCHKLYDIWNTIRQMLNTLTILF
mmetsp:Transcript_24211/g.67796  ORF Transcript_24211/g.67796 Transcript_24211/m.67796 type:complete len:80 (+) Transcript_24211:543-782(+)